MPAYIIFNYNITNQDKIGKLSKLSKASDKRSKYNQKVIVANIVKPIEGSSKLNHIVIYEFDNLNFANKWYYEESSKDVKELRQDITEGWVTIVEGYEPN
ncbi:DUF1330 domain-containing protein [Maribacter sp. IgM3_T14_3]|uniref:DUF1330 domain-containing protein n=1 Tax=Maribacter sp. IgM3_T14_3 TaxID=3415140 RepID=UPI003C6F7531